MGWQHLSGGKLLILEYAVLFHLRLDRSRNISSFVNGARAIRSTFSCCQACCQECCQECQVATSTGVHLEQKRRALRRRVLMHERSRKMRSGILGFARIMGFFAWGLIQINPLPPSPSTVIVIAEAPLGEISSDFKERCRPSRKWRLPFFGSAQRPRTRSSAPPSPSTKSGVLFCSCPSEPISVRYLCSNAGKVSAIPSRHDPKVSIATWSVFVRCRWREGFVTNIDPKKR